MSRLPPPVELRAFDAAARHLSLNEAAAEPAVTPTAIGLCRAGPAGGNCVLMRLWVVIGIGSVLDLHSGETDAAVRYADPPLRAVSRMILSAQARPSPAATVDRILRAGLTIPA